MVSRNRNNMPQDFEAPVPAWAADWAGQTTVLTTAIFAVQGDVNSAFKGWADAALYDAEFAPELVEMAKFTDTESVVNTVYIAYWRDSNYHKWWANDSVSAWWASDDRLNESSGYWREQYNMPVERLETLHSTQTAHGVARLAPDLDGPIDEHAYPGAARDRIPVSGSENVAGEESISRNLASDGNDKRNRVSVTPPLNMCVIRSGQDWGACDTQEESFYLEQVHPTLIDGMDYLANNPDESRCMTMRLMTSIDVDGNELPQTFGLGYGLDIFAFEDWAKSHPTHLKIFDSFMGHAGQFAEKMKLRLWHEVSVLPPQGGQFEYINCHAKTGLLPYC